MTACEIKDIISNVKMSCYTNFSIVTKYESTLLKLMSCLCPNVSEVHTFINGTYIEHFFKE